MCVWGGGGEHSQTHAHVHAHVHTHTHMHAFHQVDKELASGEYFLKEKEREARKREQRKVHIPVTRCSDSSFDCLQYIKTEG